MRSRLAGRACRNDASFDAPSPADERLASDSLVVPPLSIVSFYLIASPFLISFQFHPFDPSFLSFFLKDQARRKLHRRKNVEREREREKLEGIGRRGRCNVGSRMEPRLLSRKLPLINSTQWRSMVDTRQPVDAWVTTPHRKRSAALSVAVESIVAGV